MQIGPGLGRTLLPRIRGARRVYAKEVRAGSAGGAMPTVLRLANGGAAAAAATPASEESDSAREAAAA